jgi:hypothetical protein
MTVHRQNARFVGAGLAARPLFSSDKTGFPLQKPHA